MHITYQTFKHFIIRIRYTICKNRLTIYPIYVFYTNFSHGELFRAIYSKPFINRASRTRLNVSACPTCEKSINYLKCRKSRSHVTSPTCFAESPTCDYVAFNVINTPIRTYTTFKASGRPRDSRAESRRIKTSSHVEGSAEGRVPLLGQEVHPSP